eukprot:GEMP01029033.1.p1 GENE.GEMP01029033.1~~GEMP01029033.1.p1  ORF type:complete len:417 (+),score=68.49 GEMP01029033.1:428-1678(+)
MEAYWALFAGTDVENVDRAKAIVQDALASDKDRDWDATVVGNKVFISSQCLTMQDMERLIEERDDLKVNLDRFQELCEEQERQRRQLEAEMAILGTKLKAHEAGSYAHTENPVSPTERTANRSIPEGFPAPSSFKRQHHGVPLTSPITTPRTMIGVQQNGRRVAFTPRIVADPAHPFLLHHANAIANGLNILLNPNAQVSARIPHISTSDAPFVAATQAPRAGHVNIGAMRLGGMNNVVHLNAPPPICNGGLNQPIFLSRPTLNLKSTALTSNNGGLRTSAPWVSKLILPGKGKAFTLERTECVEAVGQVNASAEVFASPHGMNGNASGGANQQESTPDHSRQTMTSPRALGEETNQQVSSVVQPRHLQRRSLNYLPMHLAINPSINPSQPAILDTRYLSRYTHTTTTTTGRSSIS